jgi:phosphodiesterase/alkaline phosphatase D-like protein
MNRLLLILLIIASAGCSDPANEPRYAAGFPDDVSRVWIGPDFYTNRLQDWRLHDGRIEAVTGRAGKPMRTAQVLTWVLSSDSGELDASVRIGPLAPPDQRNHAQDSGAGFLIGAGGDDVDFRITALVHHWPSEDGGLIVGLDGTGQVVVRDNSVFQGFTRPQPDIPITAWPEIEPTSRAPATDMPDDVTLMLHAAPESGGETYWLDVRAIETESGNVVARAAYEGIPAHQLDGNIALVSHRGSLTENGPGHWFDDLKLDGSKVIGAPERSFGPIAGAFHTLSNGTLKMTAQLMPLDTSAAGLAVLEVRRGDDWMQLDSAPIDPLSATAQLRVDDWNEADLVFYRVGYRTATTSNEVLDHIYLGSIRPIPADDEFVLAALNCHHISGGDGQWNSKHFWYPHAETASSVASHRPDMLFFAGDQIYESGLAGIERSPLDVAALDYLYHWYRFVWAFRDLARDIPTVMIPDDHDVYHGNVWGAGGIKAEGDHTPFSDNGGYGMDAAWVNAVHRTQVSNLPDPVDPAPIAQDISVYHTAIAYGGISFGVVADRMFKSSPTMAIPAGDVVNGWPQAEGFDATTQADVAGAVLLGERQLRFLDDWAADWSGGTWMKVLLSQTLFANVATLPPDASSGAVLPSLDNPEPNDYPAGHKIATDMDSNGWPQTGRNRALRSIRRGFAFHVVGDQHLGSFVHYGVAEQNDSGYGFVVPSIANIWPRRWFPPQPGANPADGAPRYTGEYLDGFGNRMNVLAVANPVRSGREPAALYDRVPGYGIVRLRRESRKIEVEAWPRWIDPTAPDAQQYNGWPQTVQQEDGYGRQAAGYLPELVFGGAEDPVVQVVDESTGAIQYTLRIKGSRFRPKVFSLTTTYTIWVGEPGTSWWEPIEGLRATLVDAPADALTVNSR